MCHPAHHRRSAGWISERRRIAPRDGLHARGFRRGFPCGFRVDFRWMFMPFFAHVLSALNRRKIHRTFTGNSLGNPLGNSLGETAGSPLKFHWVSTARRMRADLLSLSLVSGAPSETHSSILGADGRLHGTDGFCLQQASVFLPCRARNRRSVPRNR